MTEGERHLKDMEREKKNLALNNWFMYALVVWFLLLQTWLMVKSSGYQPMKTQSDMASAQYSENR